MPAQHDGRGLFGWLLFAPAFLLMLLAGGLAMHEVLTRGSTAAQAASSFDDADSWQFVQDSMGQLGATALQVCSAEAALRNATTEAEKQRWQSQQLQLMAQYEKQAQQYDGEVSARKAAGARRPWDVSPVAPSVGVMKERSCLQQPVVKAKSPAVAAPFNIDHSDRFLTLEQLDAAAVAAGWPMEPGWWPDMRKIIQCETHSLDRFAHNTSDPNGGSYGLAQLNGDQHFISSGEDFNQWMDPIVNLRVALWLRTVRGHFGGTGGWAICSERWGIS